MTAIIDNGTFTYKAGTAGADAPTTLIRSYVQNSEKKSELLKPNDIALNGTFDPLTELWRHTFENEL